MLARLHSMRAKADAATAKSASLELQLKKLKASLAAAERRADAAEAEIDELCDSEEDADSASDSEVIDVTEAAEVEAKKAKKGKQATSKKEAVQAKRSVANGHADYDAMFELSERLHVGSGRVMPKTLAVNTSCAGEQSKIKTKNLPACTSCSAGGTGCYHRQCKNLWFLGTSKVLDGIRSKILKDVKGDLGDMIARCKELKVPKKYVLCANPNFQKGSSMPSIIGAFVNY